QYLTGTEGDLAANSLLLWAFIVVHSERKSFRGEICHAFSQTDSVSADALSGALFCGRGLYRYARLQRQQE
ncbi:MAG TPA: hypothetical protein VLY24_23070, partial [Bryobacteraceae bacterium]|nr:hypothetical protein [Bryobacteraceae bacterium]